MDGPEVRTSTAISPADALAQLSFVVAAALEARAGEHDLSVVQTRLLGVLRDRTPTMNELAKLLALDKSSVSGLVDRAERRGLVTRVRSASDRRSVSVTLTEPGRRLTGQVAALFTGDMENLLGTLPLAERQTLVDLAGRVLLADAQRRGVELFAGTW